MPEKPLLCLGEAWLELTADTPPELAGQFQVQIGGWGAGLCRAYTRCGGRAVLLSQRRKRRCLSYENSQTFAVVRRWLVVCPPHWLLPRISGGQCFFQRGPQHRFSAEVCGFHCLHWHPAGGSFVPP